ncbi:(2Fe-2S)-binding protein [Methylobacter sp.]|uniref:(2Fe-2S)-binding protein n=1 Tax=Methylobacter sp. TaxID=2051955 RepID=UPI002FDE033F
MYVCVCQAVTDREIHQAARNGAKTLGDLRRDLRVSVDCGRCASCARKCLRSVIEDSQQESLQLPALA